MLLSLCGLALATHVTTFDLDPLYTKAPFSGLESLVVEPATAQAQLQPMAATDLKTLEKLDSVAAPGSRTLAFTNPASNWAEVSVNALPIGIIGPYATMSLAGLRPGSYHVSLKFPTGFVRDFAVRVLPRPAVAPTSPLQVVLGIDRIEVNHRVEFDFDSADLLPFSAPILDAVAKILVDNPDVELLRIEGHTDAQGSTEYNQKLSEQRAAAVKAALVQKGIVAERLSSVGFGESKLLDTADTEDAAEKNRRVEFVVERRAAPVEPVVKPGKKAKKGK